MGNDFEFTIGIGLNLDDTYKTVDELKNGISGMSEEVKKYNSYLEETKNAEDDLTKAQRARVKETKDLLETNIETAKKIAKTGRNLNGEELFTNLEGGAQLTLEDVWGSSVRSSRSITPLAKDMENAARDMSQQMKEQISKISNSMAGVVRNFVREFSVNEDGLIRTVDELSKELMNNKGYKKALQRFGVGVSRDAAEEKAIAKYLISSLSTATFNPYRLTNLKTDAGEKKDIQPMMAFNNPLVQKAIENLGKINSKTETSINWNSGMSGLSKGERGIILSDKDFTFIASLIKNNAQAMAIAETKGFVERINGTARLRRDITIGDVKDSLSGALFNSALNTASGLYTDWNGTGSKWNPLRNSNKNDRAKNYRALSDASETDALNKIHERKFETDGKYEIKDSFIFDGRDEAHKESRQKRDTYTAYKVSPFQKRRNIVYNENDYDLSSTYEGSEMDAHSKLLRLQDSIKLSKDKKMSTHQTGLPQQVISVNENEITRFMERKNIGGLKNREATDIFKYIDLSGLDTTNNGDMQLLDLMFQQLLENKNGLEGYVLSGMHGLGENASLRLIRKDAADSINKKAVMEARKKFKELDYTDKEIKEYGLLNSYAHLATGGFDYDALWNNVEKSKDEKERRDNILKMFKAMDAANKTYTESNYYSGNDILEKDGLIVITNYDSKNKRNSDDTRAIIKGGTREVSSRDGLSFISSELGNVGDLIQGRVGTGAKTMFSVVKDVGEVYRNLGIDNIETYGGKADNVKSPMLNLNNQKILGEFDISAFKNKDELDNLIFKLKERNASDEEILKATSDWAKVQISMLGFNAVNKAADDNNVDIVGAQSNRQSIPNINKELQQVTIRNQLLAKMRAGDSDTIMRVLYNNGNSKRFKQINFDKNSPLNAQVQKDIDNWADSTLNDIIGNQGKLFDVNERGGYGYQRMGNNILFTFFEKMDWGNKSDEARQIILHGKDGKSGIFGFLEKQFGSEEMDKLGLGENSENRDMIMSKLLSLEGLFDSNENKIANVAFDKNAGLSATYYRNPGQFGETFTALNLYHLFGKYLESIGDSTEGAMFGFSGRYQLSGGDYDGDTVKDFGIRGLNRVKLMNDLGLNPNSISDTIKTGTLLSTLNSEGTALAINEQYKEQIKNAIKKREEELSKLTKDSDEYKTEVAHLSALREIDTNSTDTYSFLKENQIANSALIEAMKNEKFRERIKELNDETTVKDVNTMRQAFISFAGKSVDSVRKMGGASNIAQNISGAIMQQIIKGEFKDVSSDTLQRLALESVIGNDLYDLYSTDYKKPQEISEGYKKGVYAYSKTGTPMSRLMQALSAARVEKQSGSARSKNSVYGKTSDDKDYQNNNIEAYIETEKNGKKVKFENKDLYIIPGTQGREAFDLRVLKSKNIDGVKGLFGYNDTSMALNTLGYTSSDYAVRAAMLANVALNPEDAQRRYEEYLGALQQMVYNNPMLKGGYRKTIDKETGEEVYLTDEDGNKVRYKSTISRDGAAYELMMGNVEYLAGLASGKRFGMSVNEVDNVTKLLVKAQQEITKEAEFIVHKQKRTVKDLEANEFISEDTAKKRAEERSKRDKKNITVDSEEYFKKYSEQGAFAAIESYLKKSTGYNIWSARVGLLKDTDGSGYGGYIGGFGATNKELEIYLDVQKRLGAISEEQHKTLVSQIALSEKENKEIGKDKASTLDFGSAASSELAKMREHQITTLFDVNKSVLESTEPSARAIQEMYKSLGLAFERRKNSNESWDDILRTSGFDESARKTLKDIDSFEKYREDSKAQAEMRQYAIRKDFVSSAPETDEYKKIDAFEKSTLNYEMALARSKRLTDEIAQTEEKLTQAREEGKRIDEELVKAQTEGDENKITSLKEEQQTNQEQQAELQTTIENKTKDKEANDAAAKKFDGQRFDADYFLSILSYNERKEQATKELFGMLSQGKSVLAPYQGQTIGGIEIPFEEQRDFFESAIRSRNFKYGNIEKIIDESITNGDMGTAGFLSNNLKKAMSQERAIELIQFKKQWDSLLGFEDNKTIVDSLASGYQNRLNQLNSMYASPNDYLRNELNGFVKTNTLDAVLDATDLKILKEGIFTDAEGNTRRYTKEEVESIYEKLNKNISSRSDEEQARLKGLEEFKNVKETESYLKSIVEGRTAEEIKTLFDTKETKGVSSAIADMTHNLAALRQAASSGNPATIEKFTSALETFISTLSALTNNETISALTKGNKEYETTIKEANDEAEKSKNLNIPLNNAISVSNYLSDIFGIPHSIGLNDIIDAELNSQKEKIKTSLKLIDGKSDDNSNRIRDNLIYEENILNTAASSQIAKRKFEELFGISLTNKTSYTSKNYIDEIKQRISSSNNNEEQQFLAYLITQIESKQPVLDAKDNAILKKDYASMASRVSQYSSKDISIKPLEEAYIAEAISRLAALRDELETKIKNEKDESKKIDLIKLKDELPTSVELENSLRNDFDYQNKINQEDKMFNDFMTSFYQSNSNKRLFDSISSRFGNKSLSSLGNNVIYGTLDTLYGSIKNKQSERNSIIKDFKDKGIDITSPYNPNGPDDDENRKKKRLEELNLDISKTEELAKKLTENGNAAIIGALQKVNNYINRFILQLGRSLIKEAQNFIKTFEASMTEIQSITLKTDSEMESVRASAIQKAKDLKVSVANITKIQAALYRQGLSESEVNARTDVVAKYSAVTGQDISSSLKSLTVAVNSGLVENLQKAADTLVALGDAAATTAAEVSKGLQKSAVAAKNAGMSYEELTALLTVGTSKTQLGGSQIGRSINSILSRMTRVTNEGYSSSSDGTVSINDVEQALANVGVALREDKDTFRSATEVLLDLAGVWEDLSDVQRANVSYTLAGTTQTNVFQTLLSAMAEDDTYAELLGKAKNSEGTLDSKYEIIKESLAASMTSLKNAFDSLVENLSPIVSLFQTLTNVLSTVISGFSELGTLGSIAGFTTGIAALVAASKVIPKIITSLLGLGGLGTAAAGLNGAAASLTSAAVALGGSAATNTAVNAGATGIGALLSKGSSILKLFLTNPWVIAAIAAAATVAIGASAISGIIDAESADGKNKVLTNNAKANIKSTIGNSETIIEEIKNTIDKSYTTTDKDVLLKDALTSSGFEEIKSYFSSLQNILPEFTSSIDLTTITVDEFRQKLEGATEATDKYATRKALETLKEIDYSDFEIKSFNKDNVLLSALSNVKNGIASTQDLDLVNKAISIAYSQVNGYTNLSYSEYYNKLMDKITSNDPTTISSLYKSTKSSITDENVNAYNHDYRKSASANIYTKASEALSMLGFTEDDQKILGKIFSETIEPTIDTISDEDIIKYWETWINDNVYVPMYSFGKSSEDIMKQYYPHKYAIVGDDSGTYYYSKEEATEAAFGNERNIYDISTGKIVGSSAQDYLDTTSYSSTEQINKLNFASYVSTFDDIGEFFNDINSSSENIEKYASYLSDENLSKAALEVASGTKEFSYFIDKVNEFVGSVLEEIAYSTENIKNIETYSESYNLNNKVKNKIASSDEMNQYRISNGLPAWWTDEQVSAYASYNTEQQAATLNEVPTNFANELINIIATNLEQKGFDSNAIALMLSEEKTMSGLIQIAKDNEVVLPEYYEAMASLMDSQYAYSVPNRNTNINVVDIDKTDSEVWTGYHGSIGGTVAINPTTGDMTLLSDVVDSNGNLQYLNEAETSRYSASEWKNDKVSKVKDNNSEKVYEVQTDEGGTYITLDDNTKDYIYGMMANSSVGNYYTGYSMSGSAIPLTASQRLASASLAANTSFLRTQASDYLDLLLRLQNGESPEDVFNSLADKPTLQNYALSNGFGQLQNLYTNNIDDYYAQLTSDIESAQEAKRQLAAIGITDSTVASYITSSTRSGQLSAVSSIVGRNQNDFRAAELLAKIENGTATADDYSEYASLTNANVQEIKSNPNSARKYYSAYNADTEKQKSEFNAYTENTMKNFLVGNNIDISQFESTADMVAYIADETNGADEATRKLAEDWQSVNEGTESAAKATLTYNDALLNAKKNIDTKQAKKDMLDYINSAGFSMAELESKISGNEMWADIVAGNEEAAEIMEKYRQGIALTGDEAERLVAILAGLGSAFSYEDIDNMFGNITGNGSTSEDWKTQQSTMITTLNTMEEDKKAAIQSVYGDTLNKMAEAKNYDEWINAYNEAIGTQTQRIIKKVFGNSVSDYTKNIISGYGQYNIDLLNGNTTGASAWIKSQADEKAKYDYYTKVIESARNGENKYSDEIIKAARDYFGGYDLESDELTSAMSVFESEWATLTTTIFDKITGFTSMVASATDDLENGTFNTAFVNGQVSGSEQTKVDTFYEWVRQNPNSDWTEYADWESIKNIQTIADLFSDTSKSTGDRNWTLYNATSGAKTWGMSGEIYDNVLLPIINAMANNDFETAMSLINGNSTYSAEQIRSQISAKWGDEVNKLLNYDADRTYYSDVMKNGNGIYELYKAGKLFDNNQISKTQYDAASWYWNLSNEGITRATQLDDYYESTIKPYYDEMESLAETQKNLDIINGTDVAEQDRLIETLGERATKNRETNLSILRQDYNSIINKGNTQKETIAAAWNYLSEEEKLGWLTSVGITVGEGETYDTAFSRGLNINLDDYKDYFEKSIYKNPFDVNNGYYQEQLMNVLSAGGDYNTIMSTVENIPGLKAWITTSSEATAVMSDLYYNMTDASTAFDTFADSVGKGKDALEQFKSTSRSLNSTIQNMEYVLSSFENGNATDEQRNAIASASGYSSWEDAMVRGISEETLLANYKSQYDSTIKDRVQNLNNVIGTDFRNSNGIVKDISDTDNNYDYTNGTLTVEAGNDASYFEQLGFSKQQAEELAYENKYNSLILNTTSARDNITGELIGTRYRVNDITSSYNYNPGSYYSDDVSKLKELRYSNSPYAQEQRYAIYDSWAQESVKYNNAGRYLNKLKSGTITETEREELASYLGLTSNQLRGDNAYSLAFSRYGAKTTSRNNVGKELADSFKGIENTDAALKELLSTEEDVYEAAKIVADSQDGIYSDEAKKAAEDYIEWKDSLDDVVDSYDELQTSIASVMDELDLEEAKESINSYLTSGSATMEEFTSKLSADDAWAKVINNSSEAVRIMALYEAGIINANEAMKQLAATTSLIPVSREADVKDNREKDYKTLTSFDGLDEGTYTSANKMNSIRDFLQGKYYGAVDPRTGKRTGGLYYTDASLFEEAMQDNPYLETLMTEGISEDKWYEAYYGALGLYSTNEYLNTLGAGVLSKFTGYGDTIGSMSAALYSGDWQKWQTDVSSIATEQGQAQAYYDIMMKARRVGGAEYLDNADEVNLLKQAQEYYGFDYNDKDAESKMNEILSGFSGILNIIANLFGKDSELYKELSDYWNGKSQYAKDVANGTEASAESYTSATVNKTRQDKYDLWYDAWSKAEDKSKVNPLDYGLSGTDEAVNIYNGYNAATTGAEKNRYVTNAYNGTTLSSIRNIGSTVTEESAKAFADLVIAGKTEDAYAYLNNGNLGADTKASEIYGDSLNKLLTGNYAPEDYEYLLSDAERTGQNYFINQAKEKGTISSAAADLALQMVSYSGANQDDIDKFKNDILYSKKSEVLSANDTIYNAEKNLEKLKTFTTEEGAQSFMERNGYSWDKNLTFDENKERFIASMNSAISSGNETRKDWVAAWRFATPEQRALYGMPVTEEEFYNTYKFNPNDYTINQEQYQNEDEYTSPYKYSDEAYRGRLAYDVLNSDTKEEFLTKVQSDADYEEYIKQNAELNDIYQELQKSAGSWTKAQEKLKKELGYDATSIANVTKEAVGLTAQYQEALGMANKKTYNRKKGSDDMNFFQSLLGIDFEDLQKYSDAELNNFAQQFADSYLQQMNEQASNAADSFAVEDILGEDGTHTYQLGDMEIVPGQVIDVGIEQAIAEAHARGDADTEAILNAWKQAGAKSVTRTTVITTNGNTSTATFQYSATSKSGIGGSSKSSSGGGGSSKSAVQKAITAADRLVKAQQHRVDLLDAKADVYKEKGELTNYGKLLTYKNTEQIELQNKYREGINKIRQAMGSAKKDSDDYWSAYEKIKYLFSINLINCWKLLKPNYYNAM